MKKLLVILMVVAMASFLFVGCLPSVTPEAEEEEAVEEEEEVVVPTSATPVLTDVQDSDGVTIVTVGSSSTQYINKTELGSSILVTGTAPSESLVQIYIDDVAITPAVAEASTSGLWTIAIAKSSLGDDGVKVMTAKVTEAGLAEGEASNSATFTLDTDLPGIDSVAFSASGTIGAASLTIVATTTSASGLLTQVGASGTTVPAQSITAGTWTVTSVADSGVVNNVLITPPSGAGTYYNVSDDAVIADSFIPGITLTFGSIYASYASVTVRITIDTAATTTVAGRATIKFDEDVNFTGMSAGIYTCNLVAGDPNTYKESNDTGYWTSVAGIAAGTSYTITVYGVTDLAGNAGGTSAAPLTKSASASVASSTALAP